jgi:hypothetical protein
MVYLVPDGDWEPLAESLKRVMETGVKEHEAQMAICRAILYREIRVRFYSSSLVGVIFLEDFAPNIGGLVIPQHLEPQDFDWQQSRPLRSWRKTRLGFHVQDSDLDRLELLRADVAALCNSRTAIRRLTKGPQAGVQRSRVKGRPALERALFAIDQLYPAGVPTQAEQPNKLLCGRIGEILKESGLPKVSNDTILRAAGRRK